MRTARALGLPAAALGTLWLACVTSLVAERDSARQAWRAFEESMRAAEQARLEGDFKQAETRYLEAIDRSQSLGPRNMRLGRALDGLADLYYARERYEEAEPLYLEALEIWERLLGPEQPRVATTMHNLAALYLAQGQMDRAEPLFRRSLAIWEKSLGENSLEVAISLEAQAALLQRQDRHREAEGLIDRARSIREHLAASGP